MVTSDQGGDYATSCLLDNVYFQILFEDDSNRFK